MRTIEPKVQISVKLPTTIKNLIDEAAIMSGVSVNAFAITNLTKAADEILERNRLRTLFERDRDIFLALLMVDHKNKPD